MRGRKRVVNNGSSTSGYLSSAGKCSCGGGCSKCRSQRSQGRAAPSSSVTHRMSDMSVYPGAVHGQPPKGNQQKAAAVDKRTPQQKIDDARPGAYIRSQRAYEKIIGLTPGAPPGREDSSELDKLEAKALAEKMFGIQDPDMDKVAEIVDKIRTHLLPGGFKAVPAKAGDKDCTGRAGYVRGNKPPMVLCKPFFAGTDEERIRTLLHEAAHLSGIGQPQGESYCAVYDCDTSCGDANSADSWAHFIHCLGGGVADKPQTIQGKGGKP